MFGPPGFVYVFFVYGMHWNFNVVTGAEGQPEAVLVRAVEPLAGVELMTRRRGGLRSGASLSNGPGKLCQALAIDGRHYGMDLCGSPLLLAAGERPRVSRSARIGVDYAGSWAARPWRFFDASSPYVSRRPRAKVRSRK
jgi:DNA-3-methyladenine glycosylase